MSSANRSNPYSVMRGGAIGNTITGFVLIVVGLFVLYYLYQWIMKGDAAYSSVDILSGVAAMDSNIAGASVGDSSTGGGGGAGSGCAAADTLPTAAASITKIDNGGQYSVSFWVYVNKTSDFLTAGSSHLAHFLEISDNASTFTGSTPRSGNTLLFVGLNPKNGGLVVRQSTTNTNEQIKNGLTSFSGGSYPLSGLINNYNNETNYSARDKCDIPNGIEYQRWVLVGVVGNGRTLDTYIDGKLARSCVYKANWSIGNDSGQAKVRVGYGNGGKLKGYFSNAKYYSWALSPEEMWRTYQSGPGGPFSLWNWISQFFSVTVNVNNKAIADMSPCAACANSG